MQEDRNPVPRTQKAWHDAWNWSTHSSPIPKGRDPQPWKQPEDTHLGWDLGELPWHTGRDQFHGMGLTLLGKLDSQRIKHSTLCVLEN